jgi:hypothetical protein
MKLKCNVCESDIDIPENAKPGTRITCPTCFAQLGLHKFEGKLYLGCALCKDVVFDPKACGECERRREKKSILKEGRL